MFTFSGFRARVMDLISTGSEVSVCTSDRSYKCNAVVLATGNIPSATYGYFSNEVPKYEANPWNFDWLERVDAHCAVVIAGTSVTAIDTIISLIERPGGMRSHICGFPVRLLLGARPLHAPVELRVSSRGKIGELAKAHPSSLFSTVDLQQLVAVEFVTHGVGLHELAEVLRHSRLGHLDWPQYTIARCDRLSPTFAVQKALDAVIPELWHHCDPPTKQAFARKLGDFARVQWPMAPQNARRIVRYLRSGQLEVHGNIGQPRWDGKRFVVPFEDRNPVHGEVFINATGIGGHLDDLSCALTRRMRIRGLVVPHPLWGAISDFENGRLLNEFGHPTAPIWSGASALTRGTRLLTNEGSEADAVRRACGGKRVRVCDPRQAALADPGVCGVGSSELKSERLGRSPCTTLIGVRRWPTRQ